ncbi:hypothetical protein HPB50_020942 [Hyalomma asiaticum]|uniref:Uncharacterized protein n=1 Tax=Hyalomma asiaticum TaxID=266040 RepID=A0ACB7SXM3_HYAAI|nr:hypothetical protein HPB50_020942 [Hyalomma asiaticum]
MSSTDKPKPAVDTSKFSTSGELREYTIRPLLWEELPLTKELRLEIGFVTGTHHLETFWKTDPGSIFGAITDDGELYGVCAVPFVGLDMAYLALLGVAAKWRRRGIGKRLLDESLRHVGTQNIYLHCLPSQRRRQQRRRVEAAVVAKYAVAEGDKHNLQLYSRELKSLGPGKPNVSALVQSVPGVVVEAVGEETLPMVVRYDERVFGCPRQKFVELSLAEADVRTAVARRGSKRVCGYGFSSGDIYGNRIVRGIFADSEDIAEALMASVLQDAPLVTVVVQMRDAEEAYFEKKIGLKRCSDIKTLFRWPFRDADFTKIYALG